MTEVTLELQALVVYANVELDIQPTLGKVEDVIAVSTVTFDLQKSPVNVSIVRRDAIDPVGYSYIDEEEITHSRKDIYQILTARAIITADFIKPNLLSCNVVGITDEEAPNDLTAIVCLPSTNVSTESLMVLDQWIYQKNIGASLIAQSVVTTQPWWRYRDLYADLLTETTCELSHITLDRSVYCDMVGILEAVLNQTIILAKNNPAIRIQPRRFFIEDMQAGDIVIPEDPNI